MLKASVYIYSGIVDPTSMPESLGAIELRPLARLGVIDLERKDFSYVVSPASHNHHQRPNEMTAMLIATNRVRVQFVSVGCLHPIPTTVSMSSQTPTIIQRTLIQTPSSENHYHSSRSPLKTLRRRMVHSTHRLLRLAAIVIQLHPAERRLLYVQRPKIRHCLLSTIPSENHQIRSAICQAMSIPFIILLYYYIIIFYAKNFG